MSKRTEQGTIYISTADNATMYLGIVGDIFTLEVAWLIFFFFFFGIENNSKNWREKSVNLDTTTEEQIVSTTRCNCLYFNSKITGTILNG